MLENAVFAPNPTTKPSSDRQTKKKSAMRACSSHQLYGISMHMIQIRGHPLEADTQQPAVAVAVAE